MLVHSLLSTCADVLSPVDALDHPGADADAAEFEGVDFVGAVLSSIERSVSTAGK